VPTYRLSIGAQPYEVTIEDLSADRFRVELEGQVFEVTLSGIAGDEPSAATPAPATAHPERPAMQIGVDPALVCAPLPGTISTIETQVGARVRRGEPLLTLEAMKMNNTIRAPYDGKVAELLVAVGQSVDHDQPLLRLTGGEAS
jgi:biotin carboxyl carrier protein